MHKKFDCHDAHLKSRNLTKDYRPIVGLILTPNGPFASKNIATLSDMDEKQKLHGRF
jgi:hypothetical protein